MTEAAGVFDAWGSSLISAVVGAIFVVVGVVLAQRFVRRDAEKNSRRAAADKLTVEVANLRDAAARSMRGLHGDFGMYGLRNSLYVTRNELHGMPVYDVTWKFYIHVRGFRELMENTGDRSDEDWSAITTFRHELDTYGEQVIDLLQLHLEEKAITKPTPPVLPELSRPVGHDDDLGY